MYLTELDRDAHELMQFLLLADSDLHDQGSTGSDDVTGEFLRHITDTLRRKTTLAGRTLDRFLARTQNRSRLDGGDTTSDTPADHSPLSFTGSRSESCSDAMRDLSFHLFNVASFLTNVTAPQLLTTTIAADDTTTHSTPSSSTTTTTFFFFYVVPAC